MNRKFEEIKSLTELRCMRRSLDKRLQQRRCVIRQNVEDVRELFVAASELLTLLVKSVSLVSRMFFLRRLYVWLRSVVRRMASD